MPVNAADDPELQADLAAARKGDSSAYTRIIRRHQPALARRMTRFARSRNDIEELVHETFVEAYFSLPGYRADAPFEHWLQRIATRVGYRYWKKKRRDQRVATEPIESADDIAANETATPESREAAAKLMRVLEQLPPRDRLVVTLLHVEGHSVEETAQSTGWSRTMVKVQAFRARAKLRKLIEHEN